MIVRGMDTREAARLWAGGTDANGMAPERTVSDGDGNPCRHCLDMIGAGEPMLVLAHRPFATVQPYAEVGPVFLHAEPCEARARTATVEAPDGTGRSGSDVPRAEQERAAARIAMRARRATRLPTGWVAAGPSRATRGAVRIRPPDVVAALARYPSRAAHRS